MEIQTFHNFNITPNPARWSTTCLDLLRIVFVGLINNFLWAAAKDQSPC